MDDLDFGQKARVLWLRIGFGEIGERTDRDFESLMKAVTFVMDELAEAERATAVIAIEQTPGTISLNDIEKIHATLTMG